MQFHAESWYGCPFRPYFEPQVTNNPKFAGQVACTQELFGECRRYAVYAIHTRFDRVEWVVRDAELVDPVTGGSAIIRQEDTKSAAISGLWE